MFFLAFNQIFPGSTIIMEGDGAINPKHWIIFFTGLAINALRIKILLIAEPAIFFQVEILQIISFAHFRLIASDFLQAFNNLIGCQIAVAGIGNLTIFFRGLPLTVWSTIFTETSRPVFSQCCLHLSKFDVRIGLLIVGLHGYFPQQLFRLK